MCGITRVKIIVLHSTEVCEVMLIQDIKWVLGWKVKVKKIMDEEKIAVKDNYRCRKIEEEKILHILV